MYTQSAPRKLRSFLVCTGLMLLLVPGTTAAALSPLFSGLLAVAAALPAGGITDCNGNGIDDAIDIADQTSPECNLNGVPDECEINVNSTASGGPFFCTTGCDPDCNHTGVPDACELTGNDCNADGRPDECGVVVSCGDQGFVEKQKLSISDISGEFRVGRSVSINGDAAIVGSRGAAYALRFNGTNWFEEQRLTISDDPAGSFGYYSVSISGNTAVVGADCGPGSGCGAAYAYRYDGAQWVEMQELLPSDGLSRDHFGESVFVDAQTILVGARGNYCCGAAYVFRSNGAQWIEQEKLTASDEEDSAHFGESVGLDGETAIVGASRAGCASGACGAAYVYQYDGTQWIEVQKLTASDGGHGDEFGASASISGDTAVVGAPHEHFGPGDTPGAAYVYRFNGTSWVQQQKLTSPDSHPEDLFGRSVSVTDDTVVVSATFDDCPAGGSCGSVFVYRFDGAAWTVRQKLVASDASGDRHLGWSVSHSGDKLIAGATGVFTAYVFGLADADCDCDGVANQCDPSEPDGDGDGVPDACDICPGGDDLRDSDSDGIPDDCDECPNGSNTEDNDGDGVPDACDLCPGADDGQDIDGDTIPDACDLCNNDLPGDCTVVSPIPAGPPHDILKNRYISIQPLGLGGFNVGEEFDIQVRLTSTLVNGVPLDLPQWWVGPPNADCISFTSETRPVAPINWDACATLHITGCQIIPTSTYDIVAVVGDLLVGPPLSGATQALPNESKWWGDVVGDFDSVADQWTGPNGVVNISDVVAAIKTFVDPTKVGPGCGTPPCNATHVSVTDLQPVGDPVTPFGTPNLIVGFNDVRAIIMAFQGIEYPGWALNQCPE